MRTHTNPSPKRLLAALLVLATASLRAADAPIPFDSLPGGKVRIEGTSSIHDWQVEGRLIGGRLETGAGFPCEAGQTVSPGKVDAKVDVFIPVRSLKSVEKDGRPYSDSMDDIMYGKLLQPTYPRILYHLDELILKEAAHAADAPYVCEAKGELVVAGVTNKVTMSVQITPLGNKKLKITGNTAVKMTDFKIEPPAPKIALGLIKTGDEVKLTFEWVVGQKPPAGR
jgi:YceI-like domain